MRTIFLAAAALILASCATVPPQPRYDCSERQGELSANEHGANWSRFLRATPGTGTGTYVSASVFPGNANAEWQEDLLRDGFFAPGAHAWFSFGPPLTVSEKSIWLDLRVGGQALPPKYLSRSGGSYGTVVVTPAELKRLLDSGGQLLITFFDAHGRLLVREEIPTAAIMQAIGELPALYRKVREKMQDPAARCQPILGDIIVT